MRLIEIFEDVSPVDLKKVELALDKFVYQPEDQIEKREPVLDVDIPTSPNNHFVQRLNQRGEKAGINLGQIYSLLKAAKTEPQLGYQDDLEDLSKEQDPETDLVIKSKEKNPLTVPVIVVPNPQAVKTNIGSSVGVSATGQKVPKNRMIPKTVFRKGIDD
jgi:hypothetical protein